MKIYMVRYGNCEPPEIDSLWWTREEAESRVEELAGEGVDAWEVSDVAVEGTIPELLSEREEREGEIEREQKARSNANMAVVVAQEYIVKLETRAEKAEADNERLERDVVAITEDRDYRWSLWETERTRAEKAEADNERLEGVEELCAKDMDPCLRSGKHPCAADCHDQCFASQVLQKINSAGREPK